MKTSAAAEAVGQHADRQARERAEQDRHRDQERGRLRAESWNWVRKVGANALIRPQAAKPSAIENVANARFRHAAADVVGTRTSCVGDDDTSQRWGHSSAIHDGRKARDLEVDATGAHARQRAEAEQLRLARDVARPAPARRGAGPVLRYFLFESGNTVTTTASPPMASWRRARATRLAPDEIPTPSPSSRASICAIRIASPSCTATIASSSSSLHDRPE